MSIVTTGMGDRVPNPATAGAGFGRWERRTDLDEDQVARIRAEMAAEIVAQRLREVREQQRRTQVEVAREMGVTQKRVSEIESADLLRTEFGTLARYIDALGGRLRLVADFGDHMVTVR